MPANTVCLQRIMTVLRSYTQLSLLHLSSCITALVKNACSITLCMPRTYLSVSASSSCALAHVHVHGAVGVAVALLMPT